MSRWDQAKHLGAFTSISSGGGGSITSFDEAITAVDPDYLEANLLLQQERPYMSFWEDVQEVVGANTVLMDEVIKPPAQGDQTVLRAQNITGSLIAPAPTPIVRGPAPTAAQAAFIHPMLRYGILK